MMASNEHVSVSVATAASTSPLRRRQSRRLHDQKGSPQKSKTTRLSQATFSKHKEMHIDKENIPLQESTSRQLRGELDAEEFTKSTRKGRPTKVARTALKRVPLRQLSKEEIFVRDEAVMGDRRRRISGENLVVEFESSLTPAMRTTRRRTQLQTQANIAIQGEAKNITLSTKLRPVSKKINVFRQAEALIPVEATNPVNATSAKQRSAPSVQKPVVSISTIIPSTVKRLPLQNKSSANSNKPVITLVDKAEQSKAPTTTRSNLRRATRRL